MNLYIYIYMDVVWFHVMGMAKVWAIGRAAYRARLNAVLRVGTGGVVTLAKGDPGVLHPDSFQNSTLP